MHHTGQLHASLHPAGTVKLGSFLGCIAGNEPWIRTLGIDHGQVLAETTVGLSPAAAAQLRNQNAGRRASDD